MSGFVSFLTQGKFFFLGLLLTLPAWAQWRQEAFFQSVYLHEFENWIIQGHVHSQKEWDKGLIYWGAWIDQDQKTGRTEAYTDAQVAPLVGLKSRVVAADLLPSRYFVEGRAVFRTTPFPDQRDRQDAELRAGLLGYQMTESGAFFFEHYYAFFYTRLYNDRLVLQGWTRQGVHVGGPLDFFHEVFVDTFDLSRDSDATLDLRPGVRARWVRAQWSVQVLYQYLYHFSNLAFAGRDEQRTTAVLGLQF